jgi:alkanesulfonate monooxygenase SsuD/methylene tetrahydromethanopterin reductase-like flavin-dependent oxidoreductase (luciferase family)
MRVGFSIDPRQALSEPDELRLVELGAHLGYESAWTPSGPDAAAFDRCLRWHGASGLPTGISVVPASGQPPAFYAEQATRVWEGTGGRFVLGVGSGQMPQAARWMAPYLAELRGLLPPDLPLSVAALGPRMLRLTAEVGDGALLNWCSAEWVAWSRARLEEAAAAAGRPVPVVAEYIRTSVDPDPAAARATLGAAALQYALGPPAYRRHFERMGFADELRRLESGGGEPSAAFLAAAGAAGAPGQVRQQFERLSVGLDLAIVRVLVTRPGDAESARAVLEECRPADGGETSG